MARKVVYKITYPNGKIYVGQDVTDTLTYFGSPDASAIAQDFSPSERDDFAIRKQGLWASDSASPQEVNRIELAMIVELRANDPSVGYNRRPKFRLEG